MKKLMICVLGLTCLFALAGCSKTYANGEVYVYNWGEYIDESLLDAFEEQNNCNVLMDLGESNEIFYSKVFAGTTVYDVVCPSDYMVQKM